MTYIIERNHLTEQQQIFDVHRLSYTLEAIYSYKEDYSPSALTFNLYRDKRNCRVGRSHCRIDSSEDAWLGDIQIFNNVPFLSSKDKLYHFLHWNEPTNYQKRGLGTILLQEIIQFAKFRQVKKLQGSLTQQDVSKNPRLIKWYRKHGFQIEKLTSIQYNNALYRICLYLA